MAYAPVRSGIDLPIIMIGAYQFVLIFVLTNKTGRNIPFLSVSTKIETNWYVLINIFGRSLPLHTGAYANWYAPTFGSDK